MVMRLSALVMALFLAAGCSHGDADIQDLARKARSGSRGAARGLVEAMADGERERSLQAYQEVVALGDKVLPQLLEGIRSEDGALFEACAAALGNARHTEAVPVLIGALAGSGSRRYAAAWALGEIGDPAAVDVLVKTLSEGDAVLRKTAVRALVKLGKASQEGVLRMLDGGAQGATQRAAIRVLGELRSKAAVGTLSGVDGDNRDAAAWALGRIGDTRALPALLGALADERWAVRRQAAEALGELEDTRAVLSLRRALEDREAVVREWAARSLETITGEPILYLSEDGEMVPPYNLYR